MTGRLLYEKYRDHEPDKELWALLRQDERDFWDRLADILWQERVVVRV